MSGPGPALPPGVTPKTARDFRSAAIAAGAGQRVNPGFFDSRNTVSPFELARAKAFNPTAFGKARRGGIMDFITSGGILGNLIRGLGQKVFGFGKRYNEPTYDMSGINNTRVYENILGPSTNPENLDRYNEFVDEEDNEEYDTQLFNFDPTGFNTKNQDLYMTDALTTPTMGQYGLNLMQLNTLKNAGYSNSQIEEAVEGGYANELVKDIEGPIGIV